jgi:copper oxidase (laccase) domain-containing protein
VNRVPPTWRHVTSGSVVHARCSSVADGDFHLDRAGPALFARRAAFEPGAWTQLDEIHGTEVLVVTRPGEHDGAVADGAVTVRCDVVLAVWTGDCVPLVLAHETGSVGVVHVGWRGLVAGAVEAGVAALRHLSGEGAVAAWTGPAIGECCNEFGAGDLSSVVSLYGSGVATTTTWGTPSLSMAEGVRAALRGVGVLSIEESGVCTRCDERFFSHRRGDAGRHVVTARTMALA